MKENIRKNSVQTDLMEKENLKIALIPTDIISGEASKNITRINNRIKALDTDTDLVVLPEMVTTGFSLDRNFVEKVSEESDGPSISRLKEIASEHSVGICGTFSCVNAGKYYNRGFLIDPDTDEIFFHDKRHLFSIGGEKTVYDSGNDGPEIVTFRGWNIRLCICYDIRFPVWCRNKVCEYDLLIVPANWPESRKYAWRQLLIARAIENQSYVCGCDRLGSDHYGNYNDDMSYIFDNRGKDISEFHDNGIIYADLSKSRLIRDREKFGTWRDADSFKIDF